MSTDKLFDGSDPVRVAFEEFVSEEYRLSIDDLRSGNGYCGLQDEFDLSDIFAAFKAGRESMHKQVMALKENYDLDIDGDRFIERLKELK